MNDPVVKDFPKCYERILYCQEWSLIELNQAVSVFAADVGCSVPDVKIRCVGDCKVSLVIVRL